MRGAIAYTGIKAIFFAFFAVKFYRKGRKDLRKVRKEKNSS